MATWVAIQSDALILALKTSRQIVNYFARDLSSLQCEKDELKNRRTQKKQMAACAKQTGQ